MIPDRITVHCSASKNLKNWPIADIRKDHIERRGFRDVSYHWAIQPDGNIEKGRAEDMVGAHVLGANKGNIGICLVGTDKYSAAQLKSLASLIKEIQVRYKIPLYRVYCHYEWKSARLQNKTCPNIRASDLLYFLAFGDPAPLKAVILDA